MTTKVDLTVKVQVPTALPILVKGVTEHLRKAGWTNPQIQKTGKSTYLEYTVKVPVVPV